MVPEPAAIVEGGPAPGIIGHPIPSAIGIDPTARVEIRLPIRIDRRYGRLPAAPGMWQSRRSGHFPTTMKHNCGWNYRIYIAAIISNEFPSHMNEFLEYA